MSDCNCGFGARIPGFGTPGATFVPKVTETEDAVQLGWENNRGLPNPAPVSIPKGKEGTPGKSAYEYAKDGGYAGTEEEFAAKLAAESVPAPVAAQPGQLLVVEEVDAAGKIAKVTPMDRTHWKEGEPNEFNGDLTGREYIDLNGDGTMYLVKMSDECFSAADLIGRTLTIHYVDAGLDSRQIIAESTAFDDESEGIKQTYVAYSEELVCLYIVHQNIEMEGMTATAGTYFGFIPGLFYVKSLSGLGGVVYHPLHPDFLPRMHVIPFVDATEITVTNEMSKGFGISADLGVALYDSITNHGAVRVAFNRWTNTDGTGDKIMVSGILTRAKLDTQGSTSAYSGGVICDEYGIFHMYMSVSEYIGEWSIGIKISPVQASVNGSRQGPCFEGPGGCYRLYVNNDGELIYDKITSIP